MLSLFHLIPLSVPSTGFSQDWKILVIGENRLPSCIPWILSIGYYSAVISWLAAESKHLIERNVLLEHLRKDFIESVRKFPFDPKRPEKNFKSSTEMILSKRISTKRILTKKNLNQRKRAPKEHLKWKLSIGRQWSSLELWWSSICSIVIAVNWKCQLWSWLWS